MPRLRPFPLILLIVLLAACGPRGGADEGARGPLGTGVLPDDPGATVRVNEAASGDPCRFLIREEVAVAFEVEVASTTPAQAASVLTCPTTTPKATS